MNRLTTRVVPPEGPFSSPLCFIGEAPGAEEDKQGKPFVGRSGKLLDEWIKFLGLKTWAIINIVKCRPPENRDPTDKEINLCCSFADEQIEKIKPKLIVLLGKIAIKTYVPSLAN
ncbi:hypothetical protein LCGC14_0739260, partial [marine sediment metagenome]